ncbi:MAG: thioredoxin fold domain-containing protein [Sedimenticola sp.]|nr:thioredoxin fold domain-containing protein [Sedimenticola sp.]
MKKFSRTLLIVALFSIPFIAHAASLGFPVVNDWSLEATSAMEAQKPIMVVFSSDSCQYCDNLTEQVLRPLINNGNLNHRVHLREYKTNRGGKVRDFDGEPIRSRIFVTRYQIFATPTVLFLAPNGEIIGKPIVGFNSAESYRPLLDEAISKAAAYHSYRSPAIVTRVQ